MPKATPVERLVKRQLGLTPPMLKVLARLAAIEAGGPRIRHRFAVGGRSRAALQARGLTELDDGWRLPGRLTAAGREALRKARALGW